MDGAVPLLIGLVLLIGLLTFTVSVVLLWISFRRSFKSDKAFMISMANVLLTTIACGFAFFLADTVVGNEVLIFAGSLFIVSVLIVIRISKRTETKWLQ